MFCWTRGVQGASTGAARPQRARMPVHAWAQPIGANVLGWCDSSGEGKKHDAGQGREPWSDAPVRAQKAKALRTRVHVNRAPKISPNSWVIRRSLISSLPLLTLVARALLTVQSPLARPRKGRHVSRPGGAAAPAHAAVGPQTLRPVGRC